MQTVFDEIRTRLTVPLIAAPMFLVSSPELVTAACSAGVVGAFPTANARTTDELEEALVL
jgi:nitronate monooxygenase